MATYYLYGSNEGTILDETNYDYIIDINSNNLFDNKYYQLNPNNTNEVNIVLDMNQEIFLESLNNTKMKNMGSALSLGIESGLSYETRLLEILALKIFGHAKARAAIYNDTDIINNASNNLFNRFNELIIEHSVDIFNQYIYSKNNNYNNIENFNFSNHKFAFPIHLKGSLDVNKNGPVGGINQIINGKYNIPLLVRLTII